MHRLNTNVSKKNNYSVPNLAIKSTASKMFFPPLVFVSIKDYSMAHMCALSTDLNECIASKFGN